MIIGRNCVKNHQFRPIKYMNWAELSKNILISPTLTPKLGGIDYFFTQFRPIYLHISKKSSNFVP